ncbi:MAG: LptF/LptG family permease [Cyclobacteriaceae bacterium]|nr:LptF/LptG family permease [Cyclobacteriaceae bacterium]
MKKIDKLIIKAFIGPFILTFAVIVFILLTVQMMNYVDQIFGKDLSYVDLGVLVMHFAIFQTPIAFPLAVMLASLMTFGNLGENFELSAIKSAGISLIRAMMPIFVLVIFVTILAFFSNNYLVPNSALKAYSLLYDIRQKKPALDIEPGLFYGGIDKYKIKVESKLPDGKTLFGVIIYDHTDRNGNKDVTIADSGMMYTIMNDQYLKFELYNGSNYSEGKGRPTRGRIQDYQHIGPFTRTYFEKSEIIFDLSSFGMSRTDEGLFASNRLMRNFNELNKDLDSLSEDIILSKAHVYDVPRRFFTYSSLKKRIVIPQEIIDAEAKEDSIRQARIDAQNEEMEELNNPTLIDSTKFKEGKKGADKIVVDPKRSDKNREKGLEKKNNLPSKANKKLNKKEKEKFSKNKKGEAFKKRKLIASTKIKEKPVVAKKSQIKPAKKRVSDEEIIEIIEKKYQDKPQRIRTLKAALATTRQAKSKLAVQNSRIEQLKKSYFEFDIQWHKMLATAAACLSMFLIGAPLGAIIKKGGLGFPVLVSILFFIIYYVISIGGEKYAKTGMLPVIQGVWAANILLFPIGVFFLRQAKNDARLFEVDYYLVTVSNLIEKLRSRFKSSN